MQKGNQQIYMALNLHAEIAFWEMEQEHKTSYFCTTCPASDP